MNKGKEIKCVWTMGTSCDGEIKDQVMFKNQMTIQICARHSHDHKVILFLEQQGFDIEEILSKTDTWREEKAQEIARAKGLNIENTEP